MTLKKAVEFLGSRNEWTQDANRYPSSEGSWQLGTEQGVAGVFWHRTSPWRLENCCCKLLICWSYMNWFSISYVVHTRSSALKMVRIADCLATGKIHNIFNKSNTIENSTWKGDILVGNMPLNTML